jgi:hypothetical protein
MIKEGAGVENLYIEKGATYDITVKVTSITGYNIDLADYNIRAQVRSSAKSSDILVSFSCIIDSSTTFRMVLTPSQTSSLPSNGKYYAEINSAYYDVELEHKIDKTVIRLLNGTVSISPEITK